MSTGTIFESRKMAFTHTKHTHSLTHKSLCTILEFRVQMRRQIDKFYPLFASVFNSIEHSFVNWPANWNRAILKFTAETNHRSCALKSLYPYRFWDCFFPTKIDDFTCRHCVYVAKNDFQCANLVFHWAHCLEPNN